MKKLHIIEVGLQVALARAEREELLNQLEHFCHAKAPAEKLMEITRRIADLELFIQSWDWDI